MTNDQRPTTNDQRPMTTPSPESVTQLVAQFESELAQVRSARDAQSLRDRFLGRKNSVVTSWMQLLASAPPDQKKSIGRYANDLKQAIGPGGGRFGGGAKAGGGAGGRAAGPPRAPPPPRGPLPPPPRRP